MKKLIVVVLSFVLAGCVAGCIQSDLWKIPQPKVNKPALNVTPSSNITVRTITNEKPVSPNWPKYKLIYGRVGWGYLTVHPMILCFKNNTTTWEVWLNKSIQTTSDLLSYIKDQKWVWVNWSSDTLYINGTYFRIIAWRTTHQGAATHTKYWKEFWEKELKKLKK